MAAGFDGGAKSKVGNFGRALADVVGNGPGDGGTEMTAKTERVEMLNGEKSRADRMTNGGSFKSSTVGAAGNMRKGGNELS